MGDLSKHFSKNEFQCPCCGKLPCNEDLERLVHMLEHVRAKFQRPMIITSGYRCPDHNRRVGGVPHSYHTQCKAADIACEDGVVRMDLVRSALGCGVSRIGIYKTFIHLDIGENPIGVMWVG